MNCFNVDPKRIRALLIEDDGSQAAIIQKELQQVFLDVTACQDVETGLLLAEQQSFAVAIVDLDLNGQSGLDFVRGFNRAKKKTKIIIHSADATFESAKEGLHLGVFAYVEKGRQDSLLVDQCHRAIAAYLNENLVSANEEIVFQFRLLEAVDHGIIATDTKGKVVYWNRFSQNITGFSQVEAIGKSIFDFLLLRPDDRRTVCGHIESGGDWQGECTLQLRAKRAITIFVRLAISAFCDSRGIHMGAVISFHDLSEVKENEQRLEQRANLLAINAELGRLAVEITDRNVFLGQVAKKIFDGLSLEYGRVLLTHPTGETFKSLASVGLKSRAESGEIQLTDINHLHLNKVIDGFRIPFCENGNIIGCIEGELKSAQMLDQEKKDFLQSVNSLVSGVLLRDWATQLYQQSEKLISEQQDQLTHAQRTSTLGQIAATLAHEINQPLGAISNFSGGLLFGLKKSASVDSELSETLELIHDEAIKAGSIVNRLRKYITLDTSHPQKIDINKIIHDTLKILKHLLSNSNTIVRLELDSNPKFVQVDPVRIQQVLVNVIKNSVEAIQGNDRAGRLVKITTSTVESWVQICILDNGPALISAEMAEFFKAYYTTKSDGLGMGLCISRSIIERYHGTMDMIQMIPNGMLTTIRIPSF